MQCHLDTAVLVVLAVLFLHPASLVTAFGHHLMPSNGLAELVLRALSDITYYDHYEIRITMSSEHSAALKYTTAGQRLEPTLVAPYNGLRPLKQRKPVSRESILTQISLKSSIRNYDTHTNTTPPSQLAAAASRHLEGSCRHIRAFWKRGRGG